ncbi:hypothetical protein, partial [Acinetobacter baumannii]
LCIPVMNETDFLSLMAGYGQTLS